MKNSFVLFPFVMVFFFKSELSKLLGVKNVKVYNYYTIYEPPLNNEFYLFEKYKLSKESINQFLIKSNKKLPLKIVDSKVWYSYNWSKAKNEEENIWIFACLNYKTNNKKLKKELNDFKIKLKDKNTYCAFYCNNLDSPDKVIILLLDINTQYLRIVYSSS
jgi:hypothetical protein